MDCLLRRDILGLLGLGLQYYFFIQLGWPQNQPRIGLYRLFDDWLSKLLLVWRRIALGGSTQKLL